MCNKFGQLGRDLGLLMATQPWGLFIYLCIAHLLHLLHPNMDDGTQHKEHGINENVPQDRYHKNDFGPFSTSHMLVLDVPSQPKIKLNVCDRDIVLCVAVNKLTIHLLHLRNVRDDTVYMAWGAIQKFLKELKALNHASDKGWGFIVLHVDEVHDVHEDIRQLILAEAKKCGFLYHWSGTAYLRPKLRESNEQIYFTLRWRDGKLEANLRKCRWLDGPSSLPTKPKPNQTKQLRRRPS